MERQRESVSALSSAIGRPDAWLTCRLTGSLHPGGESTAGSMLFYKPTP